MSNFTGGSIPGQKKYQKEKVGLGKNKITVKESEEKKAWLKKTRNSPAAKSGVFTDDERWARQKASRKKTVKSSDRKMSNQRGSVLARRKRNVKTSTKTTTSTKSNNRQSLSTRHSYRRSRYSAGVKNKK